MQTKIPCVIMRGGTSRGPFFRLDDLPADPATRDAVLLAVMGSPHEIQVDGIGGAHSVTILGVAISFLISALVLKDVIAGARFSGTIYEWMVVGGESSSKRKMEKEWAASLRDQCKKLGVGFFFKQWGGVNKRKSGRMLDGRTWDQMPAGATLLS